MSPAAPAPHLATRGAPQAQTVPMTVVRATSRSEHAMRKSRQVLSASVAAPEHKAEKERMDRHRTGSSVSTQTPTLSPKDTGGRRWPQPEPCLQPAGSHSTLSHHNIQPAWYRGVGLTVGMPFSLLSCCFSEVQDNFSCLSSYI